MTKIHLVLKKSINHTAKFDKRNHNPSFQKLFILKQITVIIFETNLI